MQAEDECASCMTGGVGKTEGCAKDGPDGQNGLGGSDGKSGSICPDCQSFLGDSEGQVVPGDPGSPCDLCSEGAADSAVGVAPQVARAPPAPGLDGDAAPMAGRLGGRPLTFTLIVPFQNSREAEMARRSLIPDVHRQGKMVQKELTVTGSVLAVRWTAGNLGILQLSMNSFFTHLSLVVRIIRCIRHPFHLSFSREK